MAQSDDSSEEEGTWTRRRMVLSDDDDDDSSISDLKRKRDSDDDSSSDESAPPRPRTPPPPKEQTSPLEAPSQSSGPVIRQGIAFKAQPSTNVNTYGASPAEPSTPKVALPGQRTKKKQKKQEGNHETVTRWKIQSYNPAPSPAAPGPPPSASRKKKDAPYNAVLRAQSYQHDPNPHPSVVDPALGVPPPVNTATARPGAYYRHDYNRGVHKATGASADELAASPAPTIAPPPPPPAPQPVRHSPAPSSGPDPFTTYETPGGLYSFAPSSSSSPPTAPQAASHSPALSSGSGAFAAYRRSGAPASDSTPAPNPLSPSRPQPRSVAHSPALSSGSNAYATYVSSFDNTHYSPSPEPAHSMTAANFAPNGSTSQSYASHSLASATFSVPHSAIPPISQNLSKVKASPRSQGASTRSQTKPKKASGTRATKKTKTATASGTNIDRLTYNKLPYASGSSQAPVRMVTVLIHDQRAGDLDDEQLAEVRVILRQCENPEDGYWGDAEDIMGQLQESPARIEGAAKVYTMRGRFRQYILRISEDGKNEIINTNVIVNTERLLHVVVESLPRLGVPQQPPRLPKDMRPKSPSPSPQTTPAKTSPQSSTTHRRNDSIQSTEGTGSPDGNPMSDITLHTPTEPVEKQGRARIRTTDLTSSDSASESSAHDMPASEAPPPKIGTHPWRKVPKPIPSHRLREPVDKGYETPHGDESPERQREKIVARVRQLVERDLHHAELVAAKKAKQTVPQVLKQYDILEKFFETYNGQTVPFKSTSRYRIEMSHITEALGYEDPVGVVSNCTEIMKLLKLYGLEGSRSQNERVCDLLKDDETEETGNGGSRLLRLLQQVDEDWMNDM